MDLEQMLGEMGRRVKEYTAGIQDNWKEYSSGIRGNINQTVNDITSNFKLMPVLAELRDAANQDIKDGCLEDFIYTEEGIKFIFHPQEILPFNF